jgi:Nucleotidyl transferase AbiEii toxin, Type IV TA system
MSPGSKKWPICDWRSLLHDAVSLLDTLTPTPKWSFGGGTSLAVFYDHRISYDVDLFVASAQTITDLSPGRNPATKALLAGRPFQFPGHYLKLEMGSGEIDFISSANRTGTPVQPWEFEGREISIDTPWETAIKKIFYRSSTSKVRDVFDLAAVIEHHGDQLKANLSEVEDRLDKLLDRLDALAGTYARTATDDINPTESGQKYMRTEAIHSVISFLDSWRNPRP